MNYINTLHEGENISEIYFCKNKTVAKTKAGKTYYSLILQDKTGTLDAKIWDLQSGIDHFESKEYIYVDGQITIFNDAKQLNIRRVRRAMDGEYDEADYMPCSPKNNNDMYNELLGLIDLVKEEHLNVLLKDFFVNDKAFVEVFRRQSAAKSIHHGFIGGLMHHSISVAKLCSFYCDNYPIINRDLLITAALLHDIGKTKELSPFPENDYTDEGQLVGHIVIGAMMVRDKADNIEGFPTKIKDELIHCILSHHGKMEYGSPKTPALIEAQALAYADDTDAKLETFSELLEENSDKTGWLGYNRLLESNIKHTEF